MLKDLGDSAGNQN